MFDNKIKLTIKNYKNNENKLFIPRFRKDDWNL